VERKKRWGGEGREWEVEMKVEVGERRRGWWRTEGRDWRGMKEWRSRRLGSAEHLTPDRTSAVREGSGTKIRALP